MLTDWRKLSFFTAPNSQVLLTGSRASLSWQLSVQYQENGRRQLPSHPVSSQFLRSVRKGGNNCIKTSDHTRSNTWILRNYLSNIHMHVVILLVAVGNTLVTSALVFCHLLTHFHILLMMLVNKEVFPRNIGLIWAKQPPVLSIYTHHKHTDNSLTFCPS